eukprot:1456925-Prymnesium_polylepis.1
MQHAVPRLAASGSSLVALVLSPALLRCLMNALEESDRMLKPAANATIRALVENAGAAGGAAARLRERGRERARVRAHIHIRERERERERESKCHRPSTLARASPPPTR